MPTTGNVYRVGVGGTPAACRAGHVSTWLGLPLPYFRQLDYAGPGAMLGLKNINATGQALFAQATRPGGPAAHIENLGAGAALFTKAAGGNTINAENTGTNGGALRAVSSRTDGGPAAHIEATTVGGGGAIYAKSNSNATTINVDNFGTGTAVRAISAGGYSLMAQSSRTAPGPAAHIENLGTGGAIFAMAKTGNVLYAENTGTTEGNAINAKSASTWNTVDITNTNTGNGTALGLNSANAYALMAKTSRPTTAGPAAHIENLGLGSGLYVRNNHDHSTGHFVNAGTGLALLVQGVGATASSTVIENNGGGGALYTKSNGTHATVNFQQLGSGLALLVSGSSNLNGATTVNGNLQVNGNQNASGTKSAIVPTSDGKRLMYTEEATEVWFTDYGFGKLQDGEVFIAFDAVYAETANLNEPYHIFVQPYGTTELYVTERLANGFRVKLSKGDAASEFSYRIVAKRRNFERDRLERAVN